MITPLSTLLAAVLGLPAPQSSYTPEWDVNSGQGASGFGGSLDLVGDVNNDGFDDAIVGAPFFTNGQTWEGRVFGYLGSATGLATGPHWTYESNVAFEFLGSSLAGAGDVNGDGFDDVVVGDALYANGQVKEGCVLVFLGSATGLHSAPSAIIESNVVDRAFGGSVAGAGDVNADGFADVIVGAPGSASGGRAFIHHGSAGGLATVATTTLVETQAASKFAAEVDTAGNVDGDAYADVVVGAPAYANGQSGEGAAYVYRGSASGVISAPAWSAESNNAGALFGTAAGAGDFDLDGFDDLAIGAPGFGDAVSSGGRVLVYRGSALGLAAQPAWARYPQQNNAQFGTDVASAGDVNGDGVADLLVGAPGYKDGPGPFGFGRLIIYRGAANVGLEALATWQSSPAASGALIGMAADGGGDVNGDGFADVIGGGENFDSGSQLAQAYHGGTYASVAPYGLSKGVNPFTYPTRLASLQPPVLGGTGEINVYGGASFGGPVLLFAGSQPAALSFDDGTLNVVPDLLLKLFHFDMNGQLTLPVSLPASPQLFGVSAYLQAIYVDPAAGGYYHTVQSNGLRWTFGD